MTARRPCTGRPRQRLAGIGSRPLLKFRRSTVGVRMDEELRSKRSRRLCRLGVRFLSLPPFMERSVNGKPAVSKTATAGSSPACSAISARSPSRKAAVRKTATRRCDSGPCLHFGAVVKSGSRDTRSVQFRGRFPAAPPISSAGFRPRVCPRGETASRLRPKEQFRVRVPARAKGRGNFWPCCRSDEAPDRQSGPSGFESRRGRQFLAGWPNGRHRAVNPAHVGSNPTSADFRAPVA